jgi:hypothetical protein
MMTENQRLHARKDELIHKLAWYPNYGCYNRGGLEHVIWPEMAYKAKWIVYFDVDGVHAMNEEYETYDEFNRRIKEVLKSFRSDEVFVALANSGDEFFLVITEEPAKMENERRQGIDPEKVVERLTEELAKQGLTAIFAIEPVKSLLLDDNIMPAAERVLAAKKARGVTR